MQPPQPQDEEDYPQRQPRPADEQQARPGYYAEPPDVSLELIRQVSDLSDPNRQFDDVYLIGPPEQRQPSLAARATDATMAAIAHFAIAFGLFGIGFLLSIAINAIIWLYSRRSPYVSYHARQAGCYQCFVLVFNFFYVVLLAVVGGFELFGLLQALTSGTLGSYDWSGGSGLFLVLLILGIIWFIVSILYGIFGGIMVLLGKDFRYPYFGRPEK